MKTISIQVQDSFMQKFVNFVNSHSKDIVIAKDPNLELDPYFYERQKQLQKDIDDINSGKIEMLSQEQYNIQMNNFFKKLKYDN